MALALLLLVGLAGCRASPGDVVVAVRNLSPGAITLTTEEPGAFIFSETSNHTIQSWTKGFCFPRLALQRGHVKVTVSGSNVAGSAIYETTVEPGAGPSREIGVQIDADGRVEFGATIPPDEQPCVGGGY